MKFHVVTLFPEVVDAYTSASILGRAQREGHLEVVTHQMRDYVDNKWGKVDERPYGGGPGMVLTALPVVRAVEKIKKNKKGVVVLITSPGGKLLTNAYAKTLSKKKEVVIICGRYEGLDARAKKILKAQEVSVGDYILTGGEVPALAIIDAAARQIPGVLGTYDSLEEGRVASHEVYTRPEVLEHKGKKYRVPKVLLSGNHAEMNAWKNKKRSNPQA